jgi:hypothetical protein
MARALALAASLLVASLFVLKRMRRRSEGQDSPLQRPPIALYSPKCVEGLFSGVRTGLWPVA